MKKQMNNNGLNNCLIKESTTLFHYSAIGKYFINLILNKHHNIIQKFKNK